MDEQNFLSTILGKKGSWCGLNKQNGVLEWISGEQTSFTYWAPNEPKNKKEKRCVHISEAKNHKWRVKKCGPKHRYTCEKGSVLNSNNYTFDRPTELNLFSRTMVGDSMSMSPGYHPSGYHTNQPVVSFNIIGG